LFGAAASRSRAEMSRCSLNLPSSHPEPSIHAPGWSFCTCVRIIACTSAIDFTFG
jgi:hypothetical protein